MKKSILITLAFVATTIFAQGQYNSCAGKSEVMETRTVQVIDKQTGDTRTVQVQEKVNKTDNFGNASGNKYDLAVDGAFKGQTIVVLHMYTGENFDFELPKAALAEKGFSVYRFINNPPSPEVLEEALSKACQLWVISTLKPMLNDEHAEVIKRFFDSGKGVYLWGDNDPGNGDASFLGEKLMGVTMNGNYIGSQNVNFKTDESKSGMRADHLITTGLEYVFEGITIAKINDPNQAMEPLIYSTDGRAHV